jgi:hypothetical protein
MNTVSRLSAIVQTTVLHNSYAQLKMSQSFQTREDLLHLSPYRIVGRDKSECEHNSDFRASVRHARRMLLNWGREAPDLFKCSSEAK